MRLAVGSILAMMSAVILPVTQTTPLTQTSTPAFTLAANTTVLVTTWWGDPLSTPPDSVEQVQQVLGLAVNQYVAPASTAGTPDPTGIPTGPYNPVAVIGLAPAAFETGDQVLLKNQENLHNCIQGSGCIYNTQVGSTAPQPGDTFVVAAYSEATAWATLEKRALAAQYPTPGTGPQVSFLLLSNLNRPNGGTLARGPEGVMNPLVGLTANGSTPTDTQYPTVDITRQYDGASDAPLNPLNPLAELNASIGFFLLHDSYSDFSLQPGGGAVLQDQYGDTTYYLIPTETLPLLVPLSLIPVVGVGLADMLDPPLRVLVESAYDRTISPGQPTPYNYSYSPDPAKLNADYMAATLVGYDNLLENIGQGRPLGTVRPGPYGVGGPPVTMDPTTNQQQVTTLAAPVQPASSPSPSVTSRNASTPSAPAVQPKTVTAEATSPVSAVASNVPAPSLPSVRKPTTLSTRTIDMRGGNKVFPGASTNSTSPSGSANNPLQQVVGSVSPALNGLAGTLTNGAQNDATTSTASDASSSSG